MEKAKHLGLRIDSETHKKLKSLAEFDGRSMNGEVLYLVRQAIARHEQTYGILTSHEEPCSPNDKKTAMKLSKR